MKGLWSRECHDASLLAALGTTHTRTELTDGWPHTLYGKNKIVKEDFFSCHFVSDILCPVISRFPLGDRKYSLLGETASHFPGEVMEPSVFQWASLNEERVKDNISKLYK